jgi:integrase
MNKELIKKTISSFRQELIDRNYSKCIIWQYGKICRNFMNWATSDDIRYFSEDAARDYCLFVCGTWEYGFKLPFHERITLRCMRMLLSSFKGEEFESRTPLVARPFQTSICNHVEGYLLWCKEELLLSTISIKRRKNMLSRYDNFLFDKKIDLSDVTAYINDDFFYTCKLSYRREFKHFLREYFTYIYESKYIDKDLLSTVVKDSFTPRPEKLPSTYSTDEIRHAINAIDRSTPKGKRDYIVFLLAAEYGLRASDIVQLRMTDIDWERNEIKIIQCKTKKPLTLPLIASLGNAIIDYMRNGHPSEGGNLIIVQHGNTRKGKIVHPCALHAIVSNAIRAGNGQTAATHKHSPHSLRHSLASNMLKMGVSLNVISGSLGHSITQSTQTYLKIDFLQLGKCSLPIPLLKSELFKMNKEGTI